MIDIIFSFLRSVLNSNSNNSSSNSTDILKAIQNITSDPSSIFSKAKSNLFKFPCIVSSSIAEPSTIAIMMKGAEIEYANLVLLIAGINPFLNESDNIKIRRRLSDIHVNDNNIFHEDSKFENVINDSITEIMNPIFINESSNISSNVNTRYTNDSPSTKYLDSIAMRTYEKYNSMFNMTMINIEYAPDNSKLPIVKIPLGIKCTPHIVPTDTVVYLFQTAITSNRGLLRFFQATSGEIKFISDFLFQLDILNKQQEFSRNISSYKGWAELLKNRQASRKIAQLLKLSDAMRGIKSDNQEYKELMPICTIFLTLGDVDAIEDETGVNIFTNLGLLKKILNELLILGVFILDESTNIVHILFNGASRFESYSLRALGEAPKTKGDISDVLLNVMKRT